MKQKNQTKRLPIETAAFFIITAIFTGILLISGKGNAFSALLTFSAPSFEQNNVRSTRNDTVYVKLTPKKEDVAPSTSQDADNITLGVNQSDKPSILIYHTHTLEAYTPTEKYPYKTYGGAWRTNDNTRNIVAVGEVLANELRGYGFNVIHDTTDHEPPKLSTAYERSLITMENYKKKYPSLVMYIDLHRDACGDDVSEDFCMVNGERTAKVMFVVGTGKGATGTGFDEMPDFESNRAYARRIMDNLCTINKELVRDMRIKTGRYNQHVSNCSLLIEIGHNKNTLEEAMNAARCVAKAIYEMSASNA